MADSNKVVLKINYQGKNKKSDKSNSPKMVTEWNIKRILLALVFVILFITLLLVFISDQSFESNVDKMLSENKEPNQLSLAIKPVIKNNTLSPVDNNDNKIDDIKKPEVEETSPDINTKYVSKLVAESKFSDSALKTTEIEITQNIISSVEERVKETVEKKQKILEIKPIYNPYKNSRISRALLTSGVSNKEPVDNIGHILNVDNNETSKAYYFTEIINMKGRTLYHHWLWNDQTIFKRKINILGNRWRASTSKIILNSQLGIWNVRLVDEEGIILNEIQFDVIKSAFNN